jgi:hypothetical protein
VKKVLLVTLLVITFAILKGAQENNKDSLRKQFREALILKKNANAKCFEILGTLAEQNEDCIIKVAASNELSFLYFLYYVFCRTKSRFEWASNALNSSRKYNELCNQYLEFCKPEDAEDLIYLNAVNTKVKTRSKCINKICKLLDKSSENNSNDVENKEI